MRTNNNAIGDSSQVPLKQSLKYQTQNSQKNATNNPQQGVFIQERHKDAVDNAKNYKMSVRGLSAE